jgi:hypothetical protein
MSSALEWMTRMVNGYVCLRISHGKTFIRVPDGLEDIFGNVVMRLGVCDLHQIGNEGSFDKEVILESFGSYLVRNQPTEIY